MVCVYENFSFVVAALCSLAIIYNKRAFVCVRVYVLPQPTPDTDCRALTPLPCMHVAACVCVCALSPALAQQHFSVNSSIRGVSVALRFLRVFTSQFLQSLGFVCAISASQRLKSVQERIEITVILFNGKYYKLIAE